MWHAMFAQEIPPAEKVIRTVLVYALIAVLLRATGKRGLSGLNSLDVVVMVLLSNVVQNAVIGPDNSITGAAIGATVLVGLNSLINRAALRSERVARIFDGTDTVVIAQGKLDERAVHRIGLRRHDLDHAVRLQNGDDLDQVEEAVFDPSGQLVLTLRESEQGATKADVAQLAAQLRRLEALLTR
jgi:uncharacterized membrane protein YcaP (DUF421 family)